MDTTMQQGWLAAAAVLAASVALGYLVRAVVVHRLAAIFAKTSTEVDDLILAATRRHVPFWFLLGGLALAARLAPLPERTLLIAERACVLGLILSLTIAGARLGASLLAGVSRRAGAAGATTSLMQQVVQGIVYTCGGLLVLSNLGISVTPLLTALGIGSLAVALALQPTLSNLFAGMHLAVARPIQVGEFVELENGMQGVVADIGWRATRIREQANNLVIVPNARVSDMIVRNYDQPDSEQAVLVQVGVSYSSDLPLVERVTTEVARTVLMEVEGGVATFEPFVRFHAFGDSSINLTVVLRARRYADGPLIVHELIKRLKARYDLERIEIPFPQRVLHGTAGAAALPPREPATAGRGAPPS